METSSAPQVLLRGAVILVLVFGAAAATRSLRSLAPPDHERLEAFLDPPSINQITVRRAPTDVRLWLAADQWWVIEPFERPANNERVAALLAAWGNGWTSEGVVIAGPTQAEARAHGLMEERLEVQFEDAIDTALRVEIGTPTPGGLHHVRVGGGRTIYEAAIPHIELLSPVVEDWLHLDGVTFAPDQLVGLTLTAPDATAALTYEGGRLTYSSYGVELPDEQLPDWVLNARVAFVVLDAAPATPAQSARHAASLLHPALTVLAETERRGTFRLEIGETLPPGDDPAAPAPGAIARIEGHPTLYVVADSSLRDLRALLPSSTDPGSPPAGDASSLQIPSLPPPTEPEPPATPAPG